MFWGVFSSFLQKDKGLRGDQGYKKVSIQILKFLIWFMGKFITSMASPCFFLRVFFLNCQESLDIISRCWCPECNPWFLMWLLLIWLQDGWLTSTDWRCLQVRALWSNPHMTHVRAPCCWLRLRISTSCRRKHCVWFLCIYIKIFANQYMYVHTCRYYRKRDLFSQKVIPAYSKIPVIFTYADRHLWLAPVDLTNSSSLSHLTQRLAGLTQRLLQGGGPFDLGFPGSFVRSILRGDQTMQVCCNFEGFPL